ncbi:MAG: DUF1573 domain-containing protein [Bacteroidales bacterium]|nr:DUF1573 domain-containing protein [Bacteroidales bacterium]
MKKVFPMVMVAAAVLLSCGHKQEEAVDTDIVHNPQSAQGYNTSEKMPIITFDEDLHDFGRLTVGENISYSFKFTNTGNADLVISGCNATCGCTVASYPKERIAPGQSDYITVSFSSEGRRGQQFQEVTVMSNAQPSRTKLKIRAEIK